MHKKSSKPLFFIELLAFVLLGSASALFQTPKDYTLITRVSTLHEILQSSDFLSVLLVCSEEVESCKLLEPIYASFAEMMKDFVKIYAIDCDQLESKATKYADFPLCQAENIKHLPYLVSYEPPANKINPYTKQPSQPTERPYQGAGDPKAIANFARQNMPAFRETISSKARLDTFLGDEYIPSKVILFTNKPQTSPLYKSLASEFRDRLLFSEINEESKELVQEFGVTKYPTLLVVKRKEDGSLEKSLYEGELQIGSLRSFLTKFALTEKANRPEPQKSEQSSSSQDSERTQQQYQQQQQQRAPEIKTHKVDAQTFESEISKIERVVLVHIVSEETVSILPNITERYQRFFEYFELDVTKEENLEFVKEKLNIRSFPALVVFPVGKEKKLSAKLFVSKSKSFQDFNQDLSEFLGDKVMPISPMELQGVIATAVAKKRPAFVYLYDSNDVSLTYRMLTQLPRYEDKLTFAKLRNPTPEVLKHFEISKLPALIVVVVGDAAGDDGTVDPNRVQLAKYGGRYIYEDLSRYFDMFLPEEDLLQEMSINKKVHEVTNNEEFQKHCPPDAKICVIGLLNGDTSTPETAAKLTENLSVLNLALKKYSHLPFIWIDAICRTEILLTFNVQSESVPTVIAFSPSGREYYQLVGTFDNPSIAVFLERVSKKRISSYPLTEGINLQQKECSEIHEYLKKQESGASSSGDDDEIMREILEERRRREEAEQAGKKKKKKRRVDDDL